MPDQFQTSTVYQDGLRLFIIESIIIFRWGGDDYHTIFNDIMIEQCCGIIGDLSENDFQKLYFIACNENCMR